MTSLRSTSSLWKPWWDPACCVKKEDAEEEVVIEEVVVTGSTAGLVEADWADFCSF